MLRCIVDSRNGSYCGELISCMYADVKIRTQQLFAIEAPQYLKARKSVTKKVKNFKC